MTNIEDFRNYCLSIKGAQEKMPFETSKSEYDKSVMTFSVMGKWFCFVNIDEFEFCNLKCNPAEAKDLQAQYEGITPGHHMNKEHWISVHFHKDVPGVKIKELVKKSYSLIVNNLSRKQKEQLTVLATGFSAVE